MCKTRKIIKNLLQWLLIILVTILLAISLRVFVFDTYVIPTPSMDPAIMPGDHVVVNKLVPGPRIIKNIFSLDKGEKPVFTRLNGWDVERNDILIFNFPYSDWGYLDIDLGTYYVKRCVAVPGDTFYIERGIYKVKGVTDTLGNYQNQMAFQGVPVEEIPSHIYACFPYDSQYDWNVKEFGPLYVPARGDVLVVDSVTIPLYKNLIDYETGLNTRFSGGNAFLGDSVIERYTFKKNYYFVTGDWVFDSRDSRYWGLLPEDHIAGKVAFVWTSRDVYTKKMRWDRFLKKIK